MPTSVDPAEAGTITASSSYEGDGWGIGSAIDGQRSSVAGAMGWSSLGTYTINHTEWVRLDLGSARSLDRVDLYPRDDGATTGTGFPVDFTIQVWADGTNWTTVSTQTGYPKPGAGAQTFPFAATTARYGKVTGTTLSTDPLGHFHMQFAEIEAHGGDLALGRNHLAEHHAVGPGRPRRAVVDQPGHALRACPRPGAGGLPFGFTAATARYVRVTGTALTADPFGTYSMQLAGILVT